MNPSAAQNAQPPINTPIYFLKTKSGANDPYQEHFQQSPTNSTIKWSSHFVPVLSHTFLEPSLKTIESLIHAGAFSVQPTNNTNLGTNTNTSDPTSTYGGLIFTSQRAVEAFATVLQRIHTPNPNPSLPLLSSSFSSTTILYVVGPATARRLHSLNLHCPILGAECGNGGALADYILNHYNSIHPDPAHRPPLIFMVGEQHRDIIPKKLAAGLPPPQSKDCVCENTNTDTKIKVREITTYETGIMQSFASDFSRLVQPNLESGARQWVVVFSPTGGKAMLEGLGMLDPVTGRVREEIYAGNSNPSDSAGNKQDKRKTRIATIGPTTRDYLINEFGFQPDVVAGKPTPEGLREAIEEFEKSFRFECDK